MNRSGSRGGRWRRAGLWLGVPLVLAVGGPVSAGLVKDARDVHLQAAKKPARAAEKKATKYVCPMHPDVVSDKPGTCPKCGMKLVPKKDKQ